MLEFCNVVALHDNKQECDIDILSKCGQYRVTIPFDKGLWRFPTSKFDEAGRRTASKQIAQRFAYRMMEWMMARGMKNV